MNISNVSACFQSKEIRSILKTTFLFFLLFSLPNLAQSQCMGSGDIEMENPPGSVPSGYTYTIAEDCAGMVTITVTVVDDPAGLVGFLNGPGGIFAIGGAGGTISWTVSTSMVTSPITVFLNWASGGQGGIGPIAWTAGDCEPAGGCGGGGGGMSPGDCPTLLNPGFEDGGGDADEGWFDTTLYPWLTTLGDDPNDTGDYLAGDNAAKLEDGDVIYQEVAVEPCTDYKLFFWYSIDDDDHQGSFTANVLPGSYTSAAGVTAAVPLGSFTGFLESGKKNYFVGTVLFNSGANTTVAIYMTNPTGDDVRIDEVQFKCFPPLHCECDVTDLPVVRCPSFEDGCRPKGGGSGNEMWENDSYDLSGGPSLFSGTGVSNMGSQAAKFTSSGRYAYQEIMVEPHSCYTIEYYVRVNNGGILKFDILPNGNHIDPTIVPPLATVTHGPVGTNSMYVRETIDFCVADECHVSLFFSNPGGTSDSWVDDINFIAKTCAPEAACACPSQTTTCVACGTCETSYDIDLTMGTELNFAAQFCPGFACFDAGITQPGYNLGANSGVFTLPAGTTNVFSVGGSQNLCLPDYIEGGCFTADIEVLAGNFPINYEFRIEGANGAQLTFNGTLTDHTTCSIGGDFSAGLGSGVFAPGASYGAIFALVDFTGNPVECDVEVELSNMQLSVCAGDDTAPMITCPGATEILANGDFTGVATPSAFPTPVDFTDWNEFGDVYEDGGLSYPDKTTMKLFGFISGVTQDIPCAGGDFICMGANFMATTADLMGPTAWAEIKFEFYDAAGGIINGPFGTVVGDFNQTTPYTPNVWTKAYGCMEAPAGTAFVRPVVIFLNFNNEPGAVFVDDVSVTKLVPMASTQFCDPNDANTAMLTAPVPIDDCAVVSLTNNAPASYPPGVTVVTYSTTDANGNESCCSVLVEVFGEPVAVCNNITVQLDENGIALLDPALVGAGSIGADPADVLTYSLDVTSFNCMDIGADCTGVFPVTLTVTDQNGCSSSCVANVTVEDNVAPVIMGCPGNFFLPIDGGQCGGNYTIPALTAIDNCEGMVGTTFLGTTFVDNNGQDGNMFDISNCSSMPITVTMFDVHLNAGTTAGIEVYHTTTATTFVGNECTPSAWTLLGSATVTSAGNSMPTPVAVGGITLAPGQSCGVYVTVDNAALTMPYTNGNGANQNYSDGVLKISTGIGIPYPFSGAVCNFFSPRVWNGNVHYEFATGNVTTLVQTEGPESGAFLCYEDSPYTYTFEADDGCGNVSTCSWTVSVNEHVPTSTTMVCNNNITLTIDANCEAMITADMLLEGSDYGCYGDFIITTPHPDAIEVPSECGTGNSLLFNTADKKGTTIPVTITNPDTGVSCWGNVILEDKLPPVITSSLPQCELTSLTGEWDASDGTFSPGACWAFSGGAPQNDLLYDVIEFTAPCDGEFTFSMTQNPDYDGIAAVYEGSFDPLDPCGANPPLAGGDDLPGVFESEPEFTFTAVQGVTYFLVSSTWGTGQMGVYEWTFTGPCALMSACAFKCYDLASFVAGEIPLDPPNVMDCSTYTVVTTDWVDYSDCDADVMTRTYVATDANGNSSVFVEEILFEKLSIGLDVIFPPATIELPGCGADTSPAGIAALFDDPTTEDDDGCNPNSTYVVENHEGYPFGYPTYIAYGCDGDLHPQKLDEQVCNIAPVYTDIEIPACDENCGGALKIIRTWTIVDWCAAAAGDSDAIVEFEQVIKSVDTEAPTMQVADFTESTDPWGCNASFVMPVPELHDNCDGVITYSVHGPPGTFVTQNASTGNWEVTQAPKSEMDAGGNLIPWVFTYSATDCCGNVGTLDVGVTVIDGAPPVAIGTANIVVSLTGAATDPNGFAKLYAVDVDNGSFDGCTDVKLEVRRESDPCDIRGNTTYNDDFPFHPNDGVSNPNSGLFDPDNGEYVSFCCADAGSTVTVWLRVWDDGNMDGVVGGIGDNYNEVWVDVLVEEKLPPVISCPADLEIECGWDWQTMSGPATAFDVCGAVETTLTIQDQTDECGLGRIRATYCTVPVAANEQSVCCTQTITVIDSGTNFDIDEIGFQRDRTLSCGVIPEPEQPQWGEGHCDLIGWSSEDQSLWFEDGACRKIIRTYTVINWCTEEQVSHETKFVVIDELSPELSGGIPMYAVDNTTDPDEDCDAPIFLVKTALDPVQIDTVDLCNNLADYTTNFDNNNPGTWSFTYWDRNGNGIQDDNCEDAIIINRGCSSEWIEWKVEVDLWGDGTIDKVFSFAEGADEGFQEGRDNDGDGICYVAKTANGGQVAVDLGDIAHSCNTHIVHWTANDGCNNIASATDEFMVVDKKAPTPYCLSVSSAVMPSKGFVELWASDFDLGSSDLCGPVLISFSDTGYEPNKEFTCADDADGDGIVNVPIYVWDNSCPPNIGQCNVELTLSNCGTGGLRMIAGAVTTEAGDNVEDVEMTIDSDDIIGFTQSDMTDANGHYAFPLNPENNDYQVLGEKNDDYMNGVSTLDLVLIQKHILGTQTLNSAYKMIAADINGSQNITAIDLVELRKLILAVYTELPNNDSWRLVDATQNLTIANPWVFTEVINVNDLTADMMSENFVGVKIGDVNNSVVANATGVSTENRSNGALTLEIADKTVEAGETVSVAFMSSDYTDVYGYQFTMNLDGLNVNGITKGTNAVTAANIAVTGKTMTMSYHNSVAGNVSASDALFTLEMTATESGKLSEMISIGSSITKAEAYVGESLDVINVDLGVRTEGEVSIVEGYDLYQNEPNPFKGMTQIGFNLPQAAAATVTVYDLTGKVVKSITADFVKGHNTLQLTRNDLGASAGILYYQLESGEFTATKKMIVIE